MTKRKPVHNGAPAVVAKCHDTIHRIWVLRKGDTVSMNSSGNYDHKSIGPGLFMESETNDGTNYVEGYLDDSSTWDWIHQMVSLGLRYVEENPDEIWKLRQEFQKIKDDEPKRKGREVSTS